MYSVDYIRSLAMSSNFHPYEYLNLERGRSEVKVQLHYNLGVFDPQEFSAAIQGS